RQVLSVKEKDSQTNLHERMVKVKFVSIHFYSDIIKLRLQHVLFLDYFLSKFIVQADISRRGVRERERKRKRERRGCRGNRKERYKKSSRRRNHCGSDKSTMSGKTSRCICCSQSCAPVC